MPTRLPSRRSFWRRFSMEPETARYLSATLVEFGCAGLFVATTVMVISCITLPTPGVAPNAKIAATLLQPAILP